MLPKSNKNTFDYENNCTHGTGLILLMNNGIEEKNAGRTHIISDIAREIIPVIDPPRVGGGFIAHIPGKVSMKREQRKLPWWKR